MQDYDLAFAQETLARAYALVGDKVKAQEYLELAEKWGKPSKIKKTRIFSQGI